MTLTTIVFHHSLQTEGFNFNLLYSRRYCAIKCCRSDGHPVTETSSRFIVISENILLQHKNVTVGRAAKHKNEMVDAPSCPYPLCLLIQGVLEMKEKVLSSAIPSFRFNRKNKRHDR